MKKSFMSNIKNFVDSNVRQRIDRVANNNNDFFGDELLTVERQFEDIRLTCVEAEKRISALLQSLHSNHPSSLGAYTQNVQASLNNLSSLTNNELSQPTATAGNSTSSGNQFTKSQLSNESQLSTPITTSNSNNNTRVNSAVDFNELRDDIQRHKKLPIVGFLKFLVKSCHKLKQDSLISTTLTHCSQLQTQLTKLYLTHEQTIEGQCLKPIQHILEIEVPNVIKLRKLFIKSHNDLESVRAKYNGASQKQQYQQLQAGHFTSTSYTITQSSAQQANINKLDQLKKEVDDAVTRYEQARDTYATELYAFVCRETELVNLFVKFYQCQAEYHQQVGSAIQTSLPPLNNILANTPRKVVFGTPLEEHLRCTGRSVSLVIRLCVHLLYSNGLNEEGLFRIPGSSVKIRKLKNAINAWFVTLASQSELEANELQPSHNSSSLIAIHDLFKDIAGQQSQLQTTFVGTGDTINNQSSLRDELTYTISPSTQESRNQTTSLVLDLHTIAGLLKLYLRELPEPLFTYALYDEWIDATVKTLNNEQPDALEKVIKQLPKANYENLHHLIRFLHLLTCHSESNKMTANNLAITMAPSLIWSGSSNGYHQSTTDSIVDQQQQHNQVEDMQALNMQMSNLGISASLHALVIENLIKSAERLFPEAAQFTVPGLENNLKSAGLSCARGREQLTKQDRSTKSQSPTGLSTASSSSFSSTSNISVTSSVCKSHSRKGGSLDGLLNDNICSIHESDNKSLQANQQEYLHHVQQPPPIPPAPASRSQSRHSNNESSHYSTRTTQKPPAPPVPQTSTIKRKQQSVNVPPSRDKQINDNTTGTNSSNHAPIAISLRGSGSVALPSVPSSNINSTRPNVPPPNRPPKATLKSGGNERGPDLVRVAQRIKSVDGGEQNSPQSDNKSSHSLASSDNLREGIDAADMDDVDSSGPTSPVVSLDSASSDDSSFDNDCHSLEHSWAECNPEIQDQARTPATNDEQVPVLASSTIHEIRPAPRLLRKQESTSERIGGHKNAVDLDVTAPVKPARTTSPKMTQSTPL